MKWGEKTTTRKPISLEEKHWVFNLRVAISRRGARGGYTFIIFVMGGKERELKEGERAGCLWG